MPPRVIAKEDYCSACSLSFFDSEEAAKKKVYKLKANLEKKHQRFISFYTHIAEGKINKDDGRSTPIKTNHFGFFEFEGCNFMKQFKIISAI